uniref:Uncharacterized protein n=1 Tax=Steinernema glaseri TaxID=37863 RepID=A0A1I7Z1P2_9BILA
MEVCRAVRKQKTVDERGNDSVGQISARVAGSALLQCAFMTGGTSTGDTNRGCPVEQDSNKIKDSVTLNRITRTDDVRRSRADFTEAQILASAGYSNRGRLDSGTRFRIPVQDASEQLSPKVTNYAGAPKPLEALTQPSYALFGVSKALGIFSWRRGHRNGTNRPRAVAPYAFVRPLQLLAQILRQLSSSKQEYACGVGRLRKVNTAVPAGRLFCCAGGPPSSFLLRSRRPTTPITLDLGSHLAV